MVDTRTPEQRRRIMAAVRSADTAPEIRLRRALYAAGVRGWRCHYKGATGKPDLAWPALRVAVFVDGAFWHGHISRHKPGRSGAYWDEKIARNVERDRQVDGALEDGGWTVLRIWDFEVARDLPTVVERVCGILRKRASGSAKWQGLLISPGGKLDTTPGDELRTAAMDDGTRPEGRSFGENLRAARTRAEMPRRRLALQCGTSESSIAAYERGDRDPSLNTIVKLARALEVAPEALMRGL